MDITNPAWIALIISIIGTITSPLITTALTNRHQIQLKKLDIAERYFDAKTTTINTFLAKTNLAIILESAKFDGGFAENFFCVYQYVPDSFWPTLDNLYTSIVQENWMQARSIFSEVTHYLSTIAAEVQPKLH